MAGALIVLPLWILQSVNTTITKQQSTDLAVLFGLLWFIASAFVVSLTYLVRYVRSGTAGTVSRNSVLLSAMLVIVFGLALGGLVVDQMPCFLGVPDCD